MTRTRPPRRGDEVTGIKLRNCLGCPRVAEVLGSRYLKGLARKRGRAQKYKVARLLPDREAYLALRDEHFATTVKDLLSGAYSEVECVKEELEEWHQNMPENLQDGDVGERLQSAVYELDCVEEQEAPGETGETVVVFVPGRGINSRPRRLEEAGNMLGAAAEAMRALEIPEAGRAEWEEVCGLVEEGAESLTGVDVPGMFG